jgi:hypothetical protein
VFDSRPCFLTMVSKKALIAGLVGLVFVAGGTASVLDSFGTISGTADVQEAVTLDRIDSGSNEVDMTRNTDYDFESGDGENDLDLVNSTDDNGTVLKNDFELKSDTKNLTVSDLAGVTNVSLKIGENRVDEVSSQ